MKWMVLFQENKRPSRFVIPSLRSRASSERSEGSLSDERSFAALRMTSLNRLRSGEAMHWQRRVLFKGSLSTLCLLIAPLP